MNCDNKSQVHGQIGDLVLLDINKLETRAQNDHQDNLKKLQSYKKISVNGDWIQNRKIVILLIESVF